MGSGRPPEGVGHVDRLDGPEDLKQRLRVLLETLVGRMSVAEACERLGVSESRLHDLRRQALVGALGALMPRPAGRPVTAETTTPREEELEARIDELEIDLQAALVRTELALAMPELFRRGGKKNRTPRDTKTKNPSPPGTGDGDGT
jgi:transposase-like protein